MVFWVNLVPLGASTGRTRGSSRLKLGDKSPGLYSPLGDADMMPYLLKPELNAPMLKSWSRCLEQVGIDALVGSCEQRLNMLKVESE